MKSKFLLFLIIQFSYAVNEGSIESSDNKKKTDADTLREEVNETKKPVSSEKEEVIEDNISGGIYFANEDVMSTSVILNKKYKELEPDELDGLSELFSESDKLPDSDGPKETGPNGSASNESNGLSELFSDSDKLPDSDGLKEIVPNGSASTELDGLRNVSSDNNTSSGSDRLKETVPDSQSALGTKNFTPENKSAEESKPEEGSNLEKHEDIKVENLKDSEGVRPFTIHIEKPGHTKTETSLMDKHQSDKNNSTTRDITKQEESLNDKKVSVIQDSERPLTYTKDVPFNYSRKPLTRIKITETNKVKAETKAITETLSVKSKINEDNISIVNKDPSGKSPFDLKKDTSFDKTSVRNKNDFIIDMKGFGTYQPPFEDKTALAPSVDNEGTSKDKDNGILNKKSVSSDTEPLPSKNEHEQGNIVEKDGIDKSHSSSKIETKGALGLINSPEDGKRKDLSAVNKNSLDVGTEVLIKSTRDDKHVNATEYIGIADSSSTVDTENTMIKSSSTIATETNINDKDPSIANSSSKVDKGRVIPFNSSTITPETNIDYKDPSIADSSSTMTTGSVLSQISNTKTDKTNINDNTNVPDLSSPLNAVNKAVLSPTSTTVIKDTSNKDGFKEINSSEGKINDISGIPNNVFDNNRKELVQSVNDLQNFITTFTERQRSYLTKGVNNNENNINQNKTKDINIEFIESESGNGTTSGEVANKEKTIKDTLNDTKDVNIKHIEAERIYHSKDTILKVDDSKMPYNSSNSNEKVSQNIILGNVNIMSLSRDQPSTSTSNINEDINLDHQLNNIRSPIIESNNNEIVVDDNEIVVDDNEIVVDDNEIVLEDNSTSDLDDSNYERDSRLGTIGSDFESDSLSNFEDSNDLNFNNQNETNPGGMSNRSQGNRTAPILLKFTISRL